MLRTARASLMKIRDFGLVAIFLAVTSGLNNPAAGQNQGPTLDRPPTRTVGDTWTYKWDDQIVVVTYIGQKDGLNCYSDKAADGRQSEECFTWDDNLIRRVGTWEPFECTPSCGRLSFPLFVGKHWETSNTGSSGMQPRHRQQPGVVSISSRVVSYEKVTIPAGTFDAFKIEAWLHPANESGRYGGDIIEYYAPQLGMIKNDENYSYSFATYSINWGIAQL
jgi:hypothetical protein